MGTKTNFDTYTKTGVFRESVRGVTVGYFVGWRYHWGGRGRNIREGLYFNTPALAEDFRDSMERRREPLTREHEQIA